MVCGIIPHTLYTQSFAFFRTCFAISRPQKLYHHHFTLWSGAGLGFKKDFLVRIGLFFFHEERFHEWDFWTTTKNGRVWAGEGGSYVDHM